MYQCWANEKIIFIYLESKHMILLSKVLLGELNILSDCCKEEREEKRYNKINAGFGLREI